MEMFSLHRSKKTSETGIWIDDTEAENCACCGIRFNFLIRKHHCRQCGGVVCSECSQNRKFLESSRSGTPKRICDKCFSNERGFGKGRGEEEEEEEEDERGAGAQAADEATRKAAAAPRLPDIPLEEAVAALAGHPFEGRWQLLLTFSSVELPVRVEGAVSFSPSGTYKHFPPIGGASSRGLASKASSTHDNGPVKAGSRVRLFVDLETKGAAYFKGHCPEFGQFGQDGKVTGSVQRANGRVNATVQVVNPHSRVTTSFNMLGLMNEGGVLQGHFSGSEISKTAGLVSGIFKMMRASEGDEEGGGAGVEEEGEKAKVPTSSSSSSSSTNSGKGSGKKKAADSDGDDSEEEEERARRGKKKAAAKKAADSDDEGDGSEDDRPKKSSAKAKPAAKSSRRKDDSSDESSD